MALLSGSVTFNTAQLNDLARQFPSFGGRMLALAGSRSRTLLKESYLSGQELNLKDVVRGTSGKYLITSDVNKARTSTKIYAFPVNLFENGRMLRDGTKEAPKRIIGTKLKQDVSSRMSSYVTEFENDILNPELRSAGF